MKTLAVDDFIFKEHAMKTNKHQTLLLAQKKESLRARDVVRQFDYTPGTARSYLSYLTRQGLFDRTALGHVLTEKGHLRLGFFEAMGCGGLDCPLCINKKARHYYTCPSCKHQLPKKKARILPEWDFIIGVRYAGVYCPSCKGLIFAEEQAQLIGISKEK